MVFQKPNPFPKSIYDNVAFGPKIAGFKGNMDDLVEQSLPARRRCGTRSRTSSRSPAMALSGGQQQRLCIARAIATRPDVILMDEPCSALDPIATSRIEDLMQELVADYTIVIVTHNMQQAARVATGPRSSRSRSPTTATAPARSSSSTDGDDLHEPDRRTDRGLRHGAVRMTREALPRGARADRARAARDGRAGSLGVQRSVEALVDRDDALAQR